MTLKGIDISNWQRGLDVDDIASDIDFIVCKATEGTSFVDRECDGFIQAAKADGLAFGFYHFMGSGDPEDECDFFIENTHGYHREGIPVLDWEGNQSVSDVNEFVRRYHDVRGVWPVIYANPWRFNQGGVEENCGRWVAAYPRVTSPAIDWELPTVPKTDGLVCMWQYCSDGRLDGYDGKLDFDRFFGDRDAWNAYAGKSYSDDEPSEGSDDPVVLEGHGYKVTIEKD